MVNAVSFHPNGTSLASASSDQTIKVWDLRTNRLLQHYPAHAAAVTCFSFHPSGDYLLSGAADNTLKVINFIVEYIYLFIYLSIVSIVDMGRKGRALDVHIRGP